MTLILREISDIIDVGDREFYYTRNLKETILLSEIIEPTVIPGAPTYSRTASDTTTLTESILTRQSLIRLLEDIVDIDEAIDTPEQGIRIRTVSDTIFLSELLVRYGSTVSLIIDTITLSESLTKQRTLIRFIENWIGRLRYKRHITNTTTLDESILTQIKRLKHLITDDITLSELLEPTVIPSGVQFIRRPEDTIVLSQILSRNVEHHRTAEDSFPEKFDAASEDQFLGVKRRKLTRQPVEEKPVIEAPPTRSLLGGVTRRRHRMRSL